MKSLKIIYICITAILVCAPCFCLGQQKTEQDAAKQLISMVENDDLGQSAHAQKLFLSIPSVSKCKPVAALALTMIHIREREFSDAWKVLTAASKDKTAATESDKIAIERLRFGIQECAPKEGQTESTRGHEISTKCSLPQIEHLSGSPSGVRVEIVIVVFESKVLQVTQP